MFEEGIILYFDTFSFKNGNSPKSKFFIVLKNIDNQNMILASLPTSKDFVPSYISDDTFGCIEISDANFNCFKFKAHHKITLNDWSFKSNTYVYGNQIDEYYKEVIYDKYPIEGIDYEIVGKLTTPIFNEMLECFRKSPTVKKKYQRLL